MVDVDICVRVVLRDKEVGAFKKTVRIPESLLNRGCELYHDWRSVIYWDLDDVRLDMTTGRVCVVIVDDCLDEDAEAAESMAKWPQIGFDVVSN